MARRRMFSLDVVDCDRFLEMPQTAQNLYYSMGMRADDDGFVSSPNKILRMLGASIDDLKVLISKNFVITFESGIIVIKHWKMNNYIKKDRYTPTIYSEEKLMLGSGNNNEYMLLEEKRIQNVAEMDTQDRLGKDR